MDDHVHIDRQQDDSVVGFQEAGKAVLRLFFFCADAHFPEELHLEIDTAMDCFDAANDIPPYDFTKMDFKRVIRKLENVQLHLSRFSNSSLWLANVVSDALYLAADAYDECIAARDLFQKRGFGYRRVDMNPIREHIERAKQEASRESSYLVRKDGGADFIERLYAKIDRLSFREWSHHGYYDEDATDAHAPIEVQMFGRNPNPLLTMVEQAIENGDVISLSLMCLATELNRDPEILEKLFADIVAGDFTCDAALEDWGQPTIGQ